MKKSLFSTYLVFVLLPLCSFAGVAPKVSTVATGFPFLENKGQLYDQYSQPMADVLYYTSNTGKDIYIGKRGLQYQWIKKDSTIESYRVDFDLVGANLQSTAEAEDPSPDLSNFYHNQYPEGIVGVASYQKVTLRNIYKNIDWTFHRSQSNIEYDFIVNPGGKVADIVMDIRGATSIAITADGALKLTSPFVIVSRMLPSLCRALSAFPLALCYMVLSSVLRWATMMLLYH